MSKKSKKKGKKPNPDVFCPTDMWEFAALMASKAPFTMALSVAFGGLFVWGVVHGGKWTHLFFGLSGLFVIGAALNLGGQVISDRRARSRCENQIERLIKLYEGGKES